MIEKRKLISSDLYQFALVEKAILKSLCHPFIAEMYNTFQSANKLFITMEYCPGGSLYTQLTKFSKFHESAVKMYITEVILAIEYLHSNEIVYRDLKLSNVMLDEDGHVKLIDFGLSCKVN